MPGCTTAACRNHARDLRLSTPRRSRCFFWTRFCRCCLSLRIIPPATLGKASCLWPGILHSLHAYSFCFPWLFPGTTLRGILCHNCYKSSTEAHNFSCMATGAHLGLPTCKKSKTLRGSSLLLPCQVWFRQKTLSVHRRSCSSSGGSSRRSNSSSNINIVVVVVVVAAVVAAGVVAVVVVVVIVVAVVVSEIVTGMSIVV